MRLHISILACLLMAVVASERNLLEIKNARKEIRKKARWSNIKSENIKSDTSKPAPILAQKPNFGANFNRFKQDLNSGKFTLKAGHIKAPTMKKQPLKISPLFKNGQPLKKMPSKPISFKAVRPEFTAKLKSARPGQSVHSDWAARLGNGKVSSNLINRSKGFGNVFGKSLVEHGNRLRADQPLKIGQVAGTPSWASRIATTRRTTTTTTVYNMCLNGGSYHLGLGCLCVGNFGGDFCDECLPDWIGDNCETPKDDICTINGPEVDCSSKWIFNLTLLHLPESTQKLDMAYNGLIKSGAFRRKISTLTKLDDICLRGNYIARFPFKMFDNQPSLKKLDISSNFVFALPPDMFENSAELFDICFRHNNIKTMTKSLFEKNYKLSIVDLSNNNLSGICKGLFAYQQKLQFVAFNKNDELPMPLNKWFGECPYSREECDTNFPSEQFGGPLVNLRRRVGAFGEDCD